MLIIAPCRCEDIPKSDRSRKRPLLVPLQMICQNIAAVWIEPRKASVCGCCCVVVWFMKKGVCSPCTSPLVYKHPPAHCLLATEQSVVGPFIWHHTCPLALWRERRRRLLTMSVTSVNAGCPCINVYIYSLTSLVPHCNLFPHLPPCSSPTPLVLLMKRWWRERPEEPCNKKQTHIPGKQKKGDTLSSC